MSMVVVVEDSQVVLDYTHQEGVLWNTHVAVLGNQLIQVGKRWLVSFHLQAYSVV